MIWVDRLAVVWGTFIVAAYVWVVGVAGHGFNDPHFGSALLGFVAFFDAVPWALLRGVIWAFGGGRRGAR